MWQINSIYRSSVWLSICIVLLVPSLTDCSIYRLITETLQNNVAGEPITHQRSNWDFDPDASQQRRAIFYETHGFRATKFIDRIGVGLDGRENERRVAQRIRDEGRLNGEHNINYPVQ